MTTAWGAEQACGRSQAGQQAACRGRRAGSEDGGGAGGRTARMMLGMLPSSAMTCRRDTASTLPTMSLMRVGRYFSTWAAVKGRAAGWGGLTRRQRCHGVV